MDDTWVTFFHEWKLDHDRQCGAPLDFLVRSRHYQQGTWFINARFASLLDAKAYVKTKVAEDEAAEDARAYRLLFEE